MTDRLAADIVRDLRRYASPLMTEAADKLDSLLYQLAAAENARDEAKAKVERDRIQLRDWGNDLLNVRGLLSPQGQPNRVPVPIVPTIAPAVEWLLAEVERLRAELDARDPQCAHCDGAGCPKCNYGGV